MTSHWKPRYWSHRIILDFLVSLGTSWPRSHCFEAWAYRWSMECLDKPVLDFWSPSLSPSLKTSSTAFSASAWLTPFLDSAWHNNCIHSITEMEETLLLTIMKSTWIRKASVGPPQVLLPCLATDDAAQRTDTSKRAVSVSDSCWTFILDTMQHYMTL